MSISRILALLSFAVLFCGCTKTVQHRVADFYPGVAPATQPVPKTAVYSIRFLDEEGKKTGGVPNSHRLIQAGDHAGFDIDENKGLVAVVGDASFPISIPPGYGAVWSSTYRRPTQFSREVAKVATGTVKAAGLGAAILTKSYIEEMLDDDEDDDIHLRFYSGRKRRRD